jgi:hypothetical protein
MLRSSSSSTVVKHYAKLAMAAIIAVTPSPQQPPMHTDVTPTSALVSCWSKSAAMVDLERDKEQCKCNGNHAAHLNTSSSDTANAVMSSDVSLMAISGAP